MKIIKLDAIDSTNTFLKELCQHKSVEDFTVVIAKNQTKGRGQMNAVWKSEAGKNLMFSVLVKFDFLQVQNQFYISKAVSLAVYEVLSTELSSNISIKWPNDIMAGDKKICGILIENSVKKTTIYQSIVGIGLNVNQESYINLPNATSMKMILGNNFDLDMVLEKILLSIKKNIIFLNKGKFDKIDELYLKKLYKINKPTMFKNSMGTIFMGKIIGVSTEGHLKIELENEQVKTFNLKEISFKF